MAAEAAQLKEAAEPLLRQVTELDLPPELRSRVSYAGSQLRAASTPESVRQWHAEIEAAMAEAERQAALAAERLALAESARSLRDQANELLVEQGNDLDDEHHETLEQFDVDDDVLPTEVSRLQEWIAAAKAALADAKRFLSSPVANQNQQGVSQGALEALRKHFS
jgi:ABC-type uncharacterized transport system permease subunit